MACGVLAFHGQAVAQTISSVAIDFQILTEIRPVAHQPGTLLFESDTFSLQNKYNTVTIHGLGLDLPESTSEVTWSVEFLNLGVGRAGLLLYDPPTLGDNHDDFWEKVNGEWELKSTEDGSNFAARLAGVPLGKEEDKVIYENATTSLGKVYLTSKEVGDTVILDGDNSELTAIQFEYYAALSPFGDIPKGKVRLYLNDGESQATAEVPVDPRGELTLSPGSSVVYDNPRGVKGDIQIASGEIGDAFTLDDSRRMINQIQFEYYAALNPFESGQKGVLRFYANNGTATGEGGVRKPGDLLFESDLFPLRAGYNMVTVSDLRVRVPEEVTSVTWSLGHTGLTNIGKVGLLRHDQPAKGDSANTFWLNTGTSAKPDWQLQSPDDGRGNFSVRIAAQIPPPVSLSVVGEVYQMGEPIEVAFGNGPGNPKDWVGIYRPDAIPGSAAAPAWAYVNGSKTAGQGRTDGTVVFDEVLPSGNYVARLFENDSYKQLASAVFSIAEPPGVTTGSDTYLPGDSITVQFANGPGNPKDWIAVYRPDMVPAKVPSLLWAFVNGTQTAGEGLAAGTVTFADGLPAGAYVARYLENDGYTQLAEVSFSVTDNTAPVITLTGPPNITIDAGQPYDDAGVTAIDNAEGNITHSIQVSGEVNINRPGV
ncbi:MAG: immunoglobulin-like domain-containing protein [Verrucomicrobiota bacterium]|nr:immunoglobulin-like domain-containing protein [Verrucomicrobiota bacterium]